MVIKCMVIQQVKHLQRRPGLIIQVANYTHALVNGQSGSLASKQRQYLLIESAQLASSYFDAQHAHPIGTTGTVMSCVERC